MNRYYVKVGDLTCYIEGDFMEHKNGFVIVWNRNECQAIINDIQLEWIIDCGPLEEVNVHGNEQHS